MSGYHPDVVTLAMCSLMETDPVAFPDPCRLYFTARELLDKIEGAGFMIVDARGSETITLSEIPADDHGPDLIRVNPGYLLRTRNILIGPNECRGFHHAPFAKVAALDERGIFLIPAADKRGEKFTACGRLVGWSGFTDNVERWWPSKDEPLMALKTQADRPEFAQWTDRQKRVMAFALWNFIHHSYAIATDAGQDLQATRWKDPTQTARAALQDAKDAEEIRSMLTGPTLEKTL